jgi:hypothetical protein
MTNPTQAQIDKLTTNLGRWDDIVNGAETDTVTLDNSTVKTVSGYLAELKAYNSLGAWQTAYSYAVKDVVSESSVLYVCLVAHTSGTFSTDLSSGKWALLQTDFQNLNVSGTFSGTFSGDLTGNLTGDVTGDVTGNLTGTATNATHVTVVDNEAENENNLIPFIEDATSTGNVGLESDGDFHYNPSTGTLTATLFEGTLTTASQTNITSVGTLSSLDVSGNIRMPYSTSKYIIGPRQVASNTFRTTFDSIEINGADGLAGGSAMGGGSVIIRGGGAQGNSSTGSYGGHVKIYGGELLGGSTGAGEIFLYTNNTERIRIDGSGSVLFNTTDADPSNDTTGSGTVISSTGWFASTASGQTVAYFNRTDSSGGTVLDFRLNGSSKGSISVTTTATSYNTSSDYRLKENVTLINDAISRLMKLKPSRFNFLENKNEIVDGFLAHEVEKIIPEAVTGKKDALDEEGNPEYQSIDQSKIVPLLVASVQELTKKLEILENK